MCFKKWFNKPPVTPPVEEVYTGKTALLFAINDYQGDANDLRGCINDQLAVESKLKQEFTGFVIKKFVNSQVTVDTFISEVTKAISLLKVGDVLLIHYSGHGTQVYDTQKDESDVYDEAICLFDGFVIDDDIGAALMSIPDGAEVFLMFDSCFSGTITRHFQAGGETYIKNRYIPNPSNPVTRHEKNIRFEKSEMKWLVFGGCGEYQTSADAYINGDYNGAFTFYAIRTLKPGLTYKQWFDAIRANLPNSHFDQAPTMEGKESLFNKVIFT